MCKASAGMASDGVNTEAWAALVPDELVLVVIGADQGEIGPSTGLIAIRMLNETPNVTNRRPLGYMA